MEGGSSVVKNLTSMHEALCSMTPKKHTDYFSKKKKCWLVQFLFGHKILMCI